MKDVEIDNIENLEDAENELNYWIDDSIILKKIENEENLENKDSPTRRSRKPSLKKLRWMNSVNNEEFKDVELLEENLLNEKKKRKRSKEIEDSDFVYVDYRKENKINSLKLNK
jgi:hypothetical protein